MNKLLLFASIIAAVTTVIHAVIGGGDTVGPLLSSQISDVPRLTLYAVWHMATITLGLSAVCMFVAALPQHTSNSRYMVRFISALWLLFGVAFIMVAATQPGSGLLLKLPQWILLLPVGVLGWLGSNPSFKRSPEGAA